MLQWVLFLFLLEPALTIKIQEKSQVISNNEWRKSAFESFNPTKDNPISFYHLPIEHNLLYKDVEFGIAGAKALNIKFNKPIRALSTLDYRVDSPNGRQLAQVTLNNGSPLNLTIPITAAVDGTHDLYITASSSTIYENMSFQFSPSTPRSGIFYVIMSLMHGKVLTTDSFRAEDGGRISMWTFKNTTNQLFEFVSIPDVEPYVKILIKDTGRALTIRHNTMDRERLVVSDYKGLRTQQWKFEYTPNRQNFFIQARHSGQCIEVQSGNESDNIDLIQNTCRVHNDLNQQWMMMSHLC